MKAEFPLNDHDVSTVSEAALNLLYSWRSNGQIASKSWQISVKVETLIAHFSAPEEISLSSEIDNEYVTKHKAALEAMGIYPDIVAIGLDPASGNVCSCSEPKSYILFTTFLSAESPLHCGICFNLVPLYRIPKTHVGEYWDIRNWESNYKACDQLQMGSFAERYGERQLYNADSGLSREGRGVAARIEEVSGLPTFYYLHHANGRSLAREKKRLCPECSAKWYLEEEWHGFFAFKCEDCRLLSNIACNLQ